MQVTTLSLKRERYVHEPAVPLDLESQGRSGINMNCILQSLKRKYLPIIHTANYVPARIGTSPAAPAERATTMTPFGSRSPLAMAATR